MSISQRGPRGGQGHYVRGLDGLRAIAVVSVVVFHATDTWLRGGFLGVDVFFVLSGYLITAQLLGEWRLHARIDCLAFWRRRARRILAALYLLIAATLTFALLSSGGDVASFRGDAVAALLYVANWYFIVHHQPYFDAVAHPSPLIHLWSLGVEEQFYLLWPLLLGLSLLLLRRWTPVLVLLMAAGSAVLMAALYRPEIDPSRLYYGTDTHASGLLLGSLLAFFWSPGERPAVPGGPGQRGGVGIRGLWTRYGRDRLLCDLAGFVALVALTGFFVGSNDSEGFLYRGGFVMVAAISAGAIVALSHPAACFVTGALEWSPVRWLGTRSYSIYLWHWPVVVFTRPGSGVTATGLPLFALRVTVALVLSELSYRFVETPIRRGILMHGWRRLEDAWWTREWRWLAYSWLGASLTGGFVTALSIAVAGARIQAPPDYLAVANVDTIVRPSTALASDGATPSASAVPATATSAPPSAGAFATLSTTATTSTDVPAALPASVAATPEGTAGADVPPVPTAPPTPVSAGRVVAIGDSVMLGAVPQLSQDIAGIEVNAAVGRQVSVGIQLLQQLRDASSLGQVVIVDLGSNGTFTQPEFDQMMAVLADVPRVVFVNNKVPRSWEGPNNDVIIHGVQRYQNTRLVDWHAASESHPEYFQLDAYHLRADGAAAYAALIAAGVSGP